MNPKQLVEAIVIAAYTAYGQDLLARMVNAGYPAASGDEKQHYTAMLRAVFSGFEYIKETEGWGLPEIEAFLAGYHEHFQAEPSATAKEAALLRHLANYWVRRTRATPRGLPAWFVDSFLIPAMISFEQPDF